MPIKNGKEIVEKIQKLAALALSTPEGEEPGDEERNAAVKVVQLIHENQLAIIPREDAERAIKAIGEANIIKAEAEKAANNKMLMGLALGYFARGSFKL
jgi:hypothetical protein